MSEQSKTVYFDQVDVGDEIGPLDKKPTLEQVQAFCRAYGLEDKTRFTDLETARSEGVDEMIIPGIMSMAYLSQLITDWAPNITLKKLDIIFRAPVKHEERDPVRGRGDGQRGAGRGELHRCGRIYRELGGAEGGHRTRPW